MLQLKDLFDETYYRTQNPDVAAAIARNGQTSGLDHFLKFGDAEGRDPCPSFNEKYYLDHNPDVAAAVQKGQWQSGFAHFLQFGQLEKRDTCALFDEQLYLKSNPKVAASIADPLTGDISSGLEHYLKFGQSAGLDPHARTEVLWDEAAQQAVRNTKPGPTVASRAYGMLHTAMFDAWAAYDPQAVATQLGDSLQRPTQENTVFNKSEAISYAAYRTLVDLFPSQIDLFKGVMAQLGYDPNNTSQDTTKPSGIGNVSAQALLDFRHKDGSNQLNGYVDTTGYQPVNTADRVTDPSRWQPLRTPLNDPNGQVQKYLTPQWGNITPFGLTSGSEFRPPAPAEFGTPEYEQQAKQVLDESANLSDRQKAIAEYWEDGPGTSFPPGTWMTFGQFVSQRDAHTLDEDVKMFFILGNAVSDAGIAAWDAKKFYDSERPITAIRTLFKGQPVQAWGGPGKGTQTIDGGDWVPYQAKNVVTPNFPEYVSGHSTFSAAAAQVLKQFTGSDAFGNSFTVKAGNSRFEPGTNPSTDVTLSWATFSDAADEAGLSRRYGGIHFEQGDLEGRKLGRKVGTTVWDRAQFFITGGK